MHRLTLSAPWIRRFIFITFGPEGGSKAPQINGTIVAPSGDWLRVMPSGVSRLDVRATANQGEVKTSRDHYFVIAPTMETSAKKYEWLNAVQCIGK